MLTLKALHLIFMVTWFAALFYLPRLFVYHSQCDDAPGIARFKIMERKLLWGIATPGAVLTLVFGFWLLFAYRLDLMALLWMQLKLLLVAAMVVYHVWCVLLVRAFASDANAHSHVWYRWFNEVPVVFLVAIVFLAVLRPV